MGIDRSFLADAERGKRNVSILNLDLMAKGVEVSLSQFSRLQSEANNSYPPSTDVLLATASRPEEQHLSAYLLLEDGKTGKTTTACIPSSLRQG